MKLKKDQKSWQADPDTMVYRKKTRKTLKLVSVLQPRNSLKTKKKKQEKLTSWNSA